MTIFCHQQIYMRAWVYLTSEASSRCSTVFIFNRVIRKFATLKDIKFHCIRKLLYQKYGWKQQRYMSMNSLEKPLISIPQHLFVLIFCRLKKNKSKFQLPLLYWRILLYSKITHLIEFFRMKTNNKWIRCFLFKQQNV